MLTKKTFVRVATASALATVMASANAQIDVSAVTGTLTGDGVTALTAIGGAIAALAVIGLVFRWIKGSLF